MQKLIVISVIAISLPLILILPETGFAFHSGGVAECMGCHNIHDGKSASALLIASDPSSTCANASCHGNPAAGSYHILTPTNVAGVPPTQMTPGGDFGWLLKTFYGPLPEWWMDSRTELGVHHGHNIVAADLPGFVADDNNLTAPGGDMNASAFACTDCHDQHGKLRRLSTGAFSTTGAPIIGSGSYNTSPDPIAGQAVGAYRLLRGPGSAPGPGGKTFTAVFNAVAPTTYNRSEAVTPTKVAYGAGISDWCATCHPDMLSAASSKHTHPTNQGLSSTIVSNYNHYLGSGRTGASGYDSLVPTQRDNLRDYAQLRALSNDNTLTQVSTSDRVMCLSCHRAHASGWKFMLRWNNAGELIAVEGLWPGTDSPNSIASQAKYAQGRTVAETTAAYNGTNMHYASYQRSLCNKCHAND